MPTLFERTLRLLGLGGVPQSLTEQQEIRAASTKEAVRWGRLDRRTEHFQPAWRSGDAAIYESSDLMHRRTRNESLNNAQIKRIVEALQDLIVGPGVLTFADPFDPLLDLTDLSRESLDPLLSYALESDDLFDEWFSEREQFDVAGKRSGPEIQRMLLAECVERGGCLLVRSTAKGAGRIVPRAWQVIEYDQLDLSHDRPSGADGQNKIMHGIELDSVGREVAYWVYDDHPYDDFSGSSIAGKSSRIAAERVIHVCLFKRPSQSLGMSWLHAVGQNNFDRDKFLGSELQSAAKAATLLLVHYMKNLRGGQNLGLLDDGDASDEFGNENMKLGSSPNALRVGHEDKVELIENSRPTSSADEFLGILDHDTAGGVGLSYYSLTGRYDRTNYTSVRGALLAEDSHIRPLQNWFASTVALPIRRDFHRQAIALGKLKSVSAEQFVENPRRFSRFDAIGAGRDLLDPEAETNAATGKLRACLTTLKQECARRGQHWIRVLRQIALENRLLDILEIALDLSKGQGGQVVGNTRSKRDQQEAAAAAAGEGDKQAKKQPAKKQGAKK
jgi:lambda family phage portal protein